MCPVNLLTDHDVSELHRLLREIPVKAIAVNADSNQFPEDWLFRWRWDKGKKPKAKKAKGESQDAEEEDVKPKGIEFLALVGGLFVAKLTLQPDGSKATISFVTVGGRTSAVVNELQKLPSGGGSAKANGSKATPKKPKAAAKKRPADSVRCQAGAHLTHAGSQRFERYRSRRAGQTSTEGIPRRACGAPRCPRRQGCQGQGGDAGETNVVEAVEAIDPKCISVSDTRRRRVDDCLCMYFGLLVIRTRFGGHFRVRVITKDRLPAASTDRSAPNELFRHSPCSVSVCPARVDPSFHWGATFIR